jgi:hypothetical protein
MLLGVMTDCFGVLILRRGWHGGERCGRGARPFRDRRIRGAWRLHGDVGGMLVMFDGVFAHVCAPVSATSRDYLSDYLRQVANLTSVSESVTFFS